MKCASQAVSTDGWQPWRFRLYDQYVELSAHTRQAADSDDPDDREMLIRCGAALLHLKLTLKRYGCLGRVELFPDMAQSGLVARIHGGLSSRCMIQEETWFDAMARKRNKSTSWSEPPLSESVLGEFQSAGSSEKAWLEFSRCESSRARLVEIAETVVSTPATAGGRAPRPEPSRVSQWTRPLLTFVVRAGEAKKITVESSGRRANEMAALAVIKTKTDDKHGWLATGEAMARVKLQARASEIASQVFDRAFQNRRIREILRMSIGRKGFVQGIIGFGLQPAHWTFAASEPSMAGHIFGHDADLPSRLRTD